MSALAEHLARPQTEFVCGDATNEATITAVRLLRDAVEAGSPDLRVGRRAVTWKGGSWPHFPDAIRVALDQVLACDEVLRAHVRVEERRGKRVYTFM